jgi:hypothetical protein
MEVKPRELLIGKTYLLQTPINMFYTNLLHV